MVAAGSIVGEYQYLCDETDADLLAMQVGDFFEFFGENAEIVHEHLDLKLTTKPSDGKRYPMAGVPVNEIDGYVHALVERGFRVAIARQHKSDNGHARAVERIVTPGTSLKRSSTGYLVAVVRSDDAIALALVDVATGRCYADRLHSAPTTLDVIEILEGLDLAEVLVGPGVDVTDDDLDVPVIDPDPSLFDDRRATDRVTDRFGGAVVETLDLEPPSVRAVGAILGYVESNDPALLTSLTRLRRYRADDTVTLDATTQRNLELTETFTGDREGSLFAILDHTVTPGGRRLLVEWLRRPTRDVDRLDRRLQAIHALYGSPLVRDALADTLAETADLDRLATRCGHGSATPHDLGLIRDTLAAVPALLENVEDHPDLEPIVALFDSLDLTAIERLTNRLEGALVDDPPAGTGDGGYMRLGWDDALDDVIEEHNALREWFDGLAEREASRYGFERVTVGFTRADGYYIQVPENDLRRVPDHYDRVKTVAAGTRYRTEEIIERERRFLRLEERRTAMEREAFERLRASLAESLEHLQACARAIAGLDIRRALAMHAARHDWTRPTYREDGVIEIDRGRHPVVEQTTRFVPNDCRFDDDRGVVLVTGPNMSGKSTYLRQVALITLLAQIGSFVPAKRAAITPVDGIYTRVGALDELAQGRSTFMVEMQELARILHQATDDSLVVLDEVGRGTSTYDGMSIAWAATEYLHNEVGARTLFATHYHELTVLGEHLPRVANVHVAVDESDDSVVFLRSVEPGPTDRSYGVHVAEMAGVPGPVVDRSHEVLDRLREDKAVEARGGPRETTQVVFDLQGGVLKRGDDTSTPSASDDVLEAMSELDLTTIAPIDLVGIVRDWQSSLETDDD